MSAWTHKGRLPESGRFAFGMRCAVAACAAAFAFALACLPGAAFAEDGDEENMLNTRQMPDSSFIYDTSLADLAGADSYFDGQTVQVVGEAIGDNLNADLGGQHRWITLGASDATSSPTLSVYMTSTQASVIDIFGRYGSTGTTVQVRGIYHLVCNEHDGISDLHAESVSLVKKGSVHTDRFSFPDLVPGIVLVLLGVALACAYYYLRERQR